MVVPVGKYVTQNEPFFVELNRDMCFEVCQNIIVLHSCVNWQSHHRQNFLLFMHKYDNWGSQCEDTVGICCSSQDKSFIAMVDIFARTHKVCRLSVIMQYILQATFLLWHDCCFETKPAKNHAPAAETLTSLRRVLSLFFCVRRLSWHWWAPCKRRSLPFAQDGTRLHCIVYPNCLPLATYKALQPPVPPSNNFLQNLQGRREKDSQRGKKKVRKTGTDLHWYLWLWFMVGGWMIKSHSPPFTIKLFLCLLPYLTFAKLVLLVVQYSQY